MTLRRPSGGLAGRFSVLLALVVNASAVPEAPEAAAVSNDDECRSGGDGDVDCAMSAVQLRARRAHAEKASKEVADGEFVSSKPAQSFEWTAGTRGISAAISASGWQGPAIFGEAASGHGAIDAASLATWVEQDLLATPPFAGSHSASVPWPQQGEDQVGPGQYVGYSRRQVCYIVAKALTGADTRGYPNGLTRLMGTCARTGGFAHSMVALLTACAADPTLAGGRGGPMVLVARGADPPAVHEARSLAADTPLADAGLRVCQYDDDEGAGELPETSVDRVPGAGCVRPPASGSAPGTDFMTGGLPGQATQDISASFLGGYVFGNACGLGGGQDERLMVYFPEVAALTFFLSGSSEFPQLRQPAWVLGARRLFTGLDGSARWNAPLAQDAGVPLGSDLATVDVDGKSYAISSSRPFLAFMSENQGFLGRETADNLHRARKNQHPRQRKVGDGKDSFARQVRAWYGSVALGSYHAHVQPALRSLVRSVGTGPWLAGLWWGDSQLGLLAVWIGHALAAQGWGSALPVDYYMYADFTESPGNQCYVHSHARCAACLQKCQSSPLPGDSFWMPNAAFYGGQSCADAGLSDACGTHGLEDVLARFGSGSAGDLWRLVEQRIQWSDAERTTVFDALLQ